MAQTSSDQGPEETRKRPHQTRNRWLVTVAVAVGVLVVAFAIAAEYIARHAGPLLRGSVVATLTTRFHSPVQLDSLEISVVRGIEVHGHGLRIFYLAGPTQPDLEQKQGSLAPPMLSVNNFTFRTTLNSLLHLRVNLARVDIDGMELHIPPHTGGKTLHITPPKTRIKLTVAKIYCKNVKLVIETAKPDKAPLEFDIKNLELTDVGGGQPMLYAANVLNPKPIGDVHAVGHFGPWQSDDPRTTALDGHYTFTHADLNSIKGLGGILSSTGQFEGQLNHITIDGTTSTPDFSLDISDHPVPLETKFHAYVDGTTGDTTLDPVEAVLLHSPFTTRGIVMNIHGKGHDIALTVDMPHGRMEDLLQLGMKARPPIMRGAVTLQAKLHIPPGDVRVAQKIQLSGKLHIQGVEFSNAKLQDHIDGLSMRAQGKPKDVKAADSDRKAEVASQMAVDFSLGNGIVTINSLHYQVPGAQVNLHGVDSLDGNIFDFKGHLRTDAMASQMVSGWKSILLAPLDPFLKKHGAGVQLPISVSGTDKDVHFGLAMHDADESTKEMEADIKRQHPSAPTPKH